MFLSFWGSAGLLWLLSAGPSAYMLMGGDDKWLKRLNPPNPVREAALYQPLDPAFVVNYTHEGRRRGTMQVSAVLRPRWPTGMASVAAHMPLIPQRAWSGCSAARNFQTLRFVARRRNEETVYAAIARAPARANRRSAIYIDEVSEDSQSRSLTNTIYRSCK